jgi:SAM-dependent methyltransferase
MASVKRRRWGSLAAPIALGVLAAGLAWATHRFASGGVGKQARLLAFVVPVLICYGQRRDPLHFGLGLGAILLGVSVGMAENRGILFVERTFFGIHRVVADATGERHTLLHGTTLHGEQNLSSAFRRVAGSYYARTGPLGQTFEAVDPALKNDVAIVGLGAGSVAAYAEAGQRWTFYEIDPTVMRIAGDTRYFTFVADCAATVRIVLGDARLSLMRATNQMFGVIVLDAYNSDAVPLHLITREALALYLQRLQPHGILAFHISNRHLDLETVLGNLARDAGLSCLVQTDGRISGEDEAIGKRPSRWALVARDAADLLTLKIDKRWRTARVQPAARVWTDDYASLFDVVQLHADKRAGP